LVVDVSVIRLSKLKIHISIPAEYYSEPEVARLTNLVIYIFFWNKKQQEWPVIEPWNDFESNYVQIKTVTRYTGHKMIRNKQ
jgi:hypothetical protein